MDINASKLAVKKLRLGGMDPPNAHSLNGKCMASQLSSEIAVSHRLWWACQLPEDPVKTLIQSKEEWDGTGRCISKKLQG